MYAWRDTEGLGQVANALTCIAYSGPNCVASAYPPVGGTEYNPAILPSPQTPGVYSAIPSMSGGPGVNPADPTLPEFLWTATGQPYVPGQTAPGAVPASPVTPVASPVNPSPAPVASSGGMSTTTILILAALGIGAVLFLGGR